MLNDAILSNSRLNLEGRANGVAPTVYVYIYPGGMRCWPVLHLAISIAGQKIIKALKR
jgi:hypothetical protein